MTTCFRSGIRAFGRRDFDRLNAVARRLLRDPQDAQDCVQDALVKALAAADQFAGVARQAEIGCAVARTDGVIRDVQRRQPIEQPFDAAAAAAGMSVAG